MKAITAILNDCSQECQCATTRTCPAPLTSVCVAQYSQRPDTSVKSHKCTVEHSQYKEYKKSIAF